MNRWTDEEMRETLDASAEKSREITDLRAEVERLSQDLETLHAALTTAREDALEEAARVAEYSTERQYTGKSVAQEITAAIRALKEKP